jgi:hypothetical protein
MKRLWQNYQPNQKYGRLLATAEVKAKPDMDSATLQTLMKIMLWPGYEKLRVTKIGTTGPSLG